MKKIKLGLLMDQLDCDAFLFDLITILSRQPNIELYLLMNQSATHKGKFKKILDLLKEIGLFKFINILLFMLLVSLEKKIITLTANSTELLNLSIEKKLNPDIFSGEISLTPHFLESPNSKKRIFVSYNNGDIEKISSLDLDLILRGNGSGIFKGKILQSAKDGIISFHHGDNRWNRGGPYGFWEVYFRKPETGFIIQILNEKLDDGDVIFRGEMPTSILYTLNKINLLQTGNIFMERIIKEYATTGLLPPVLPKTPYSYMLLKSPKLTQLFLYCIRSSGLIISSYLKFKILRKNSRWSVAFVRSDWKNSNLSKATIIKNPKGRFLADPFVITRSNQTMIFVEDYNFLHEKGVISAIQIFPDGSYEILSDIIKEDFHLSFPYLFEYKGILYMIPETSSQKTIRLYKCIKFPHQWQFLDNLMENVDALDSMIFEHSDMWWLLTNMAPDGSSSQDSQLCVFSATSPLSRDWQPHPKNPVCFSPEYGRNGGLLRDKNGSLFRVRQKQGFNHYGKSYSIAKINRLDLDFYEELFYCEVEPKFFPNLTGTHHMSSERGITVFDFVKEEIII